MALVTAPAIKAAIAVITEEKRNEYGPYRSVLFESRQLSGGKLWRMMPLEEAEQLHRGMQVELTQTKTKKGKEGWNIRPLSTQRSQPAQPQSTAPPQPVAQSRPPRQAPISEIRRQQIEAFIFSMANLHAVCYQAAEQAYAGQSASDEVIRAATSSVFIAAERRFRLCSPGD